VTLYNLLVFRGVQQNKKKKWMSVNSNLHYLQSDF